MLDWDFTTEGPMCGWRWSRYDAAGAIVDEAERTFETLVDCAEDAERHGYVRVPAQMAMCFARALSARARAESAVPAHVR